MTASENPAQPAHKPAKRSASTAWVDALQATVSIEKNPHQLLGHMLASIAETQGDQPALLSARESFTFAELAHRMAAYARWADVQGLQPGDRVALIMSNRPEYVAVWLGLSMRGIVTALINTNLTGPSLSHCLKIAKPRAIIAETRLIDSTLGSLENEGALLQLPVVWGVGDAHAAAKQLQLDAAGPAPMPETSAVSINDTALLIYTSGTTGMPKAANVSHRRVLNWALWFKGLLGNTASDRMYDCLPLYHSVGGIVAVAATLVAGGSTVIAEKFSARQFWNDVRAWNCTQVQYIGELCRYLLNAPPQDAEHNHALRVIVGNGLRGDVWPGFQERFAIPQIVEFYAATEGNFSLFNAEGKPGAIGRIPPFLRHRFPTAIVKFDSDANTPLRGPDGFCVAAAVGEPGEAIGRIGDGSDASGRFDGYTDSAESERKILRNVFETGDAWFRTGDLMQTDQAGYYYFVDRIGDTFRWKGENVSTLEVENTLTSIEGVKNAVVYGVAVPGADGRAGMALLETGSGFDLAAFTKQAKALLPSYAVPVFVRIGAVSAITETFKQKKQDLVRDGFDPRGISDEVHALVAGAECYARLDLALYEAISAGHQRL